MAIVKQFGCFAYGKAFIFIVIAVFSIVKPAFASEDTTVAPPKYIVESLRCISAEEGKEFISKLKIGTISILPTTNALLITAGPDDLIKIKAVLKTVDNNDPYVIEVIMPAKDSNNLPPSEKIEQKVPGISIGTFTDLPEKGEKSPVIIDFHKNTLICVAPADKIQKVINVVKKLRTTDKKQPEGTEISIPAKPVEQNEVNQPELITEAAKPTEIEQAEPQIRQLPPVSEVKKAEEDDLFINLLKSLEKAEKKAAEKAQISGKEPVFEPEQKQIPEALLEKPEVETEEQSEIETTLKLDRKTVEVEIPRKPSKPAAEIHSYTPEPMTGEDADLKVTLPETLEITQLLRLVGEYLHLDYMYNPEEVKGTVTLKLRGPIKVKELYPLTEQTLQFKGFVMTRKGNLVTIVPKEKVLSIDPELYSPDGKKLQTGDVTITSTFKLEYIDTATAENLLKSMNLGVNIVSIPETGTLIITEYAYRMSRIEQLLRIIDKPGKPRKFRFRQLRYTMAGTLAAKVEALAGQLGTISITIAAPAVQEEPQQPTPSRGRPLRTRTPAPTPQPQPETSTAAPSVYLDVDERTNRILMIGLDEQLDIVEQLVDTLDVERQDLRALRLYEIQYVGADEVVEKLELLGIIGAEQASRGRITRDRSTRARPVTTPAPTTETQESLVEEPQVVIIEATNSLLVNATDEQHIQIATIISYVDNEQKQAAINYVIYQLENQAPEELSTVLNELITQTVTTTGGKGKDDKIERTTTPARSIEEEITIVPDAKSYSLIVYASKRNQQWIKTLIEQLDQYRPQVLLDVTLVEITKNNEFTFDLDLVTKFPKLNRSSTQQTDANGNPIGGIVATGSMDALTALIDPFPLKRVTEATSNSGSGSGFYADEHIQALLTAMDKKGYGRILAKPKLLVNDNEPGTIKAEETTYRSRKSTSIIGTENTATTEQIIFEDYSAGITLEIQPHISKGNQLRLQIALIRSDFRDTAASLAATDPTPPDKITSDVKTVVTVPDSKTIILGGLEKINQSKGGTKVPLLGDIPLIGTIFRSTSDSDVQSKLYVFVKAHILRPGEKFTEESDIEVVSRKNRDAFEKMERKFQELKYWPGVKPESMEPEKVLEVD